MSRAEAAVLIARLNQAITDLADLRDDPATPQHVVQSSADHIDNLREAARELARLHGVTQ